MDQLFRIVLDVKDADKAAREIKKLKEAYKEVGTSAREIGTATIGGADPFAAATQTPPPVPGATVPGTPAQAPAAAGAAVRPGGAALPGMVSSAGGIAMAAGRGDAFSAGAGMASTAGGILSKIGGTALKAAPWAFAGAAALGLAGKLTGGEEERVRAIYGGGVSQRLGMGYESTRAWGLEMGRAGVYAPTVQSYMSGLGLAGGSSFNEKNMLRAQKYGIEGGTTGGFQATLQRAGFTGTVDKSVYQVLEKAFGAGRIGTLFQSMGAIIEDSLATGATRATETLKGGATEIAATIAGLSQFGGISMEGALETYQTMLQKGRGAARVQSPQDIIAFRAARKGHEGESIHQTRLRMERDPMLAIRGQLGFLSAAYGDDTDKIKESLTLWGYKPSQSEAIVNQRKAISLGKGVDKSLFLEEVREGSVVAQGSLMVQQIELLADAAKSLENLRTDVVLFFANKDKKGETSWDRDYRLYLEKEAEVQKNSNILLEAIKDGIITGNDISGRNEAQILELIGEIMKERQNKVPINKTESVDYYRGERQ